MHDYFNEWSPIVLSYKERRPDSLLISTVQVKTLRLREVMRTWWGNLGLDWRIENWSLGFQVAWCSFNRGSNSPLGSSCPETGYFGGGWDTQLNVHVFPQKDIFIFKTSSLVFYSNQIALLKLHIESTVNFWISRSRCVCLKALEVFLISLIQLGLSALGQIQKERLWCQSWWYGPPSSYRGSWETTNTWLPNERHCLRTGPVSQW